MLFCDSINTGFSSNPEDRSSRIQLRHLNASMTVIPGSPGTHWCKFVHSSDTLYCNTKFMLLQVTDFFNCNRHNIGGISGDIKMGESLVPTLL